MLLRRKPFDQSGAALAVALDGGVGASGSAAAQDLTDVVEAYIGNGAIVHAMGSVFIDANDNTDLLVIAGSVAGGVSAGVGHFRRGRSLDANRESIRRPFAQVDALGEGADFSDPEGTGLTGTGVVIDATYEDETLVFAAGAGGGSEASVAASAVVDTETSDTEAYIGQSATVITPASVQVHAEEDTNSITVAGAFAGSLEIGVGAAADVQVLSRTVKAHRSFGRRYRRQQCRYQRGGAGKDHRGGRWPGGGGRYRRHRGLGDRLHAHQRYRSLHRVRRERLRQGKRLAVGAL